MSVLNLVLGILTVAVLSIVVTKWRKRRELKRKARLKKQRTTDEITFPVLDEENVAHFRRFRDELVAYIVEDVLPRATGRANGTVEGIDIELTPPRYVNDTSPYTFSLVAMMDEAITLRHPVVGLHQRARADFIKKDVRIENWTVKWAPSRSDERRIGLAGNGASHVWTLRCLDNASGKELERQPGVSLEERIESFAEQASGESFLDWCEDVKSFWRCGFTVALGERSFHCDYGADVPRGFGNTILTELLGEDTLKALGDGPIEYCESDKTQYRLTTKTTDNENARLVVRVCPDPEELLHHNVRFLADSQEKLGLAAARAGLRLDDPALIIHHHEAADSDAGFIDDLVRLLRAVYEKSEEDMERAAEALECIRYERYDGGVVIEDITYSARPGLARGAVRAEAALLLCTPERSFLRDQIVDMRGFSYPKMVKEPSYFVRQRETFTLYNA